MPVFKFSPIPPTAIFAILFGLAAHCNAWAEDYFDANRPPTKEELVRILKLPDEVALTRSIRRQSPFFLINIPFSRNSTHLNEEAKQLLGLIGGAMQELPGQNFIIEGHADSTGKRDKNRVLSQRRAESAKSYLVDEYQIDPGLIKPEGKGSDELIDPDNPESERNRSVKVLTYRP